MLWFDFVVDIDARQTENGVHTGTHLSIGDDKWPDDLNVPQAVPVTQRMTRRAPVVPVIRWCRQFFAYVPTTQKTTRRSERFFHCTYHTHQKLKRWNNNPRTWTISTILPKRSSIPKRIVRLTDKLLVLLAGRQLVQLNITQDRRFLRDVLGTINSLPWFKHSHRKQLVLAYVLIKAYSTNACRLQHIESQRIVVIQLLHYHTARRQAFGTLQLRRQPLLRLLHT